MIFGFSLITGMTVKNKITILNNKKLYHNKKIISGKITRHFLMLTFNIEREIRVELPKFIFDIAFI